MAGINNFSRRPKKNREPLEIVPPPESILAVRNIAERDDPGEEDDGGGIASPLTEQEYTGSTYYNLTSSNGLFVFEFPDETDYLDAVNREVKVIHRDPDTP